ncbi:uncharacterized protein LOC126820459 [Patella vulgata]|uniref:uncharacterized protein LOC126820459 n=1 Tax=Patella vulgata TaxID=6465 RepID=UPI0021805274|nr:uncharacterized protein LOC126820459 [Patella vulgata]
MSSSHMPERIILILLTIVLYLVTLVVNALAAQGGVELGLFKTNMADISEAYKLEITSAGLMFSVWDAIYIWQALWLVYGLSTICRMKGGHYIYTLDFMPPAVYIIFIIYLCCNIIWLFLWDNQYVFTALCLIAMTPFTLYFTLYICSSRLYRNMTKGASCVDIWLVRFLVQNGMAFYATWTFLAAVLNLDTVLSHWHRQGQDTASTAILVILFVEVVVWFIIDIFLYDKYTRYIFSPYLMRVIVFSGLVKNDYAFDTIYHDSALIITLLVVAVAMLFLKISILVFRHITSPIISKKLAPITVNLAI